MGKSTRTTISVPADLKARMDSVDEPVNWSAVACSAFEHRLAEIITRKGARDMKDVIARLKASKQKLGNDRYNEGFAAGQGWAKGSAEADELERLHAEREGAGTDWDRLFHNEGSNAYGPCEWIVFAISPNDNGDRSAARDFWEQVSGPDFERLRWDDDYVMGFVDGALEVWAEVKDQL